MSYIVCISKDAYKQNNTYYLRKGNTMKKSFVFAAVAATIAASSAMALTEITPTGTNTVEWSGTIQPGQLTDVCNFIGNASGEMTFSGDTWTSDDAAFVELKQRGAHMIKVVPDHYVREVDGTGNILAGGVAHAVNVDYSPDTADGAAVIGASGSQATAYIQDTSNPQQVGNVETDLDSTVAGVRVFSYAGSNSGSDVVSNTATAPTLDDTKKARFYIQGDVSGTSSVSVQSAIPFGHLKLDIAGTATLVNSADKALLKNGSRYAITHTVTCLK